MTIEEGIGGSIEILGGPSTSKIPEASLTASRSYLEDVCNSEKKAPYRIEPAVELWKRIRHTTAPMRNMYMEEMNPLDCISLLHPPKSD